MVRHYILKLTRVIPIESPKPKLELVESVSQQLHSLHPLRFLYYWLEVYILKNCNGYIAWDMLDEWAE